MALFDISLDTANRFYTLGWIASLGGAAITLLGVAFLMWGTGVRELDTEQKLSRANTDAANAIIEAANLNVRAALLEKEAAGLRLELMKRDMDNETRSVVGRLLAEAESNLLRASDFERFAAA
jgi:hypothetical protein